jgi:hypothetical protein
MVTIEFMVLEESNDGGLAIEALESKGELTALNSSATVTACLRSVGEFGDFEHAVQSVVTAQGPAN